MIIIKNEFFKLLSNRTLICTVIILLVLNSISLLLSGKNFGDENYGIPDSAYRLMQEDLTEVPNEKRLEFIDEKIYEQKVYNLLSQAEQLGEEFNASLYFPMLSEEKAQAYIDNYASGGSVYKYTGNVLSELNFLEMIYRQASDIYNYEDFLNETQNQLGYIGILWGDTNSFAAKNTEKTAQAYSKLPKQNLRFNITESIKAALNGKSLDICILLTVCFSAIILICGEREINAFSLLKTLKKGQITLIMIKTAAMFIFCMLITMLFIADSFIICGIRFGFCDMSAPIQSVKGFMACPFNLKIWQYLFFFIAAKICAYFVIAMTVFAISIFAKSNVVIYIVSGAIIFLETAMYNLIDSFSALAPLKYINIIAFTDTNEIIGNYRNMNIIGYPVNITAASAITAIILLSLLILAAAIIFVHYQGLAYHRYDLSAVLSKIYPFGRRISVSLFRHELYKILILNNGIILLLLMFFCSIAIYDNYSIMPDESDGYFRQYVLNHGGEITDETALFIAEETERFEAFSEENGVPTEYDLNSRAGFEIFSERYAYAAANSTEIVYDTGWNILFGKKAALLQLLILFTFMSIMTAPVFSADSRIRSLIITAPNGRMHDILIRIGICGVLMIIMFMFSHIPIFLKICKFYGTDGLFSAAQSVLCLHTFALNVSLVGYLILRYCTLILISFIVMIFMLYISGKMSSQIVCTVFLLSIFSVPCVILLMII